MPIKKSELYSSLWASCDELRGGMDASQYKDYVLVLLFIKYISDKYAGVPYAPITIPPGASFKDMVTLKGKPDIGDQINKKIIAPLASANKLSDFPDFNEPNKLGSGKEMVDRLTNLIAIFENKALDFSKNRAEGDDILGDAYEYLMRHFATESGKSKGQFYTPAEVSRVIAQIVGIREARTSADTSVSQYLYAPYLVRSNSFRPFPLIPVFNFFRSVICMKQISPCNYHQHDKRLGFEINRWVIKDFNCGKCGFTRFGEQFSL